MQSIDPQRDPLPEEFPGEDEAGEFWDSHSLADYQEFLEAADVEIDLERRRFEIEVEEGTFLRLNSVARETHQPVKELASQILSRGLVLAPGTG